MVDIRYMDNIVKDAMKKSKVRKFEKLQPRTEAFVNEFIDAMNNAGYPARILEVRVFGEIGTKWSEDYVDIEIDNGVPFDLDLPGVIAGGESRNGKMFVTIYTLQTSSPQISAWDGDQNEFNSGTISHAVGKIVDYINTYKQLYEQSKN